jgi:hypothetical protein
VSAPPTNVADAAQIAAMCESKNLRLMQLLRDGKSVLAYELSISLKQELQNLRQGLDNQVMAIVMRGDQK